MGLLVTKQVAAASVPNSPTGTYTIFLDVDGIEKKKDEFGVVTLTSSSGQNDKVKVSAADTTEGYLEGKILGTSNKIEVIKTGVGNETFVINIGTDVFDKLVDDSDSVTEGVVNLLLTVGERSAIATNSGKVSNATHTGEVTGATVLTIDPSFISGKGLVTATGTMDLIVNDGGTYQRVKASDFLSGVSVIQSYAEMYFNTNNTTDTVVGATNTPVKIIGVTTQGQLSSGWSMPSDNRLLWSGVGTLKLKVEMAISINKEQAGGADNYRMYINVNGSVVNKTKMKLRGNNNDNDSASVSAIIDLPSGQYIEGWIENTENPNDLEVNDFFINVVQILT